MMQKANRSLMRASPAMLEDIIRSLAPVLALHALDVLLVASAACLALAFAISANPVLTLWPTGHAPAAAFAASANTSLCLSRTAKAAVLVVLKVPQLAAPVPHL
jgi:hypothetical protein